MLTGFDDDDWIDTGIPHTALGELLLGHSPSKKRNVLSLSRVFKIYYGSAMPILVPTSGIIIKPV